MFIHQGKNKCAQWKVIKTLPVSISAKFNCSLIMQAIVRIYAFHWVTYFYYFKVQNWRSLLYGDVPEMQHLFFILIRRETNHF